MFLTKLWEKKCRPTKPTAVLMTYDVSW